MPVEPKVTDTGQLAEPRGICRDGLELIVDLKDYVFPRFCIVTGKAVEKNVETLCVKCHGINLVESEESRGFGTVASAFFIKSFTANLKVGVVAELSERLRRSNLRLQWGARLIWIGVLVGIVGVVLSQVLRFIESPWATMVLWSSVGGAGLAIANGAVILQRRERFARSCRRVESIIWLSGLHPEFLRQVPARDEAKEFAHVIKSRIRVRVRDSILAGGVFLTIGLALAIWGLAGLLEQLDSQTWKDVSGTIVSSDVRHIREKGGRRSSGEERFEFELVYEYVVEGVPYHGTRHGFGRAPSSHHRSGADMLVRQNSVGTGVIVYYDEQDPRRCSLSRAEHPWRSFGWRFAPGLIGIVALCDGLRWRSYLKRWSR